MPVNREAKRKATIRTADAERKLMSSDKKSQPELSLVVTEQPIGKPTRVNSAKPRQ